MVISPKNILYLLDEETNEWMSELINEWEKMYISNVDFKLAIRTSPFYNCWVTSNWPVLQIAPINHE